MDLHPLEKKVLEGLRQIGGKGTATDVADIVGIEKIQAERFGYSLSNKGIIKLRKEIIPKIEITELGKKYLEKGLPEDQILSALLEKKLSLDELEEETGLNQKEISAAIGILRKKAYISSVKTEKGLELEITSFGKEQVGKKSDLYKALKNIKEGREVKKAETLETLRKRGLISLDRQIQYFLELKKDISKDALKEEKLVHQLTHEMLKTGSWKNIKFRKYDLEAPVQPYYGGKLHPLTLAKNKIRKIFFELGFEEKEGPLVESSFWNFDALFQPQDHPARDLADTFYLENPKTSKLPERKIVENVKEAHEKGTTESKGWQYEWNEELAKTPILRTHTTAVTCRSLLTIEPPAKIFCIGRTFRNETVDFKHLPEFTQIDGIVADENVTFRDLLGYLKEFFWRLGFKKIRFRPAYFPYTEMSVEPEIYLEDRGEWIELGGSGIFRPEVTEPLGIDVPVLAWGLSLERPIMLKLGLEDIRNFYYKNDLKWLREVARI